MSCPSNEALLNRLDSEARDRALAFVGGISDFILDRQPDLLADDEANALRAQRAEAARSEALRLLNVYVGYGNEPERGRIERVERLTCEPPVYRLDGTAATATASMAQIAEWRLIKPKLMEAANRYPSRPLVPSPDGRSKPMAWDRICPSLMAAAAPVDIGAETTEAGLGRQWLDEYVAASQDSLGPLRRVETHVEGLALPTFQVVTFSHDTSHVAPYKLGGYMYVHATSLRLWLNLRDEHLTRHRLAAVLRLAGGSVMREGKPTTTIWAFADADSV